MLSWKSSVLKAFAFFSLGVLFSPPPLSAADSGTSLHIVLSNISSFTNYRSIQDTLRQTEGITRVTIEREAPGWIGLNVEYSGSRPDIKEALSALPQAYVVTEKSLPSGLSQVIVSLR